MADQEDVEVLPSGLALQQVSAWLGVDAEAVLAQETDPAVEAMFNKPHPSLLGLGAKYLSHTSMEASGLELKLKHTLRKSTGADAGEQYQPAQLDRHMHKRRRHEEQQPHGHGKASHRAQLQQQQQNQLPDSDSDEEAGKLGRLKQHSKAVAPTTEQQGKVLNRQHLLQVPSEQLSKWQRKQMRKKAKKQAQQQQQQLGG